MTCAYDLYRIIAGCLQYSDFISIASTPAYYRKADSILDRDIPMVQQINLSKRILITTHRLSSVEKLDGPRRLDDASLRMLQKTDVI